MEDINPKLLRLRDYKIKRFIKLLQMVTRKVLVQVPASLSSRATRLWENRQVPL